MPQLSIPHLILTVKDFQASRIFYKALFVDFLGCEVKIDTEDFFYFRLNSDDVSVGISPENKEFENNTFNRYRVGLHHFAIELENRQILDKTFQKVQELGCEILDEPQVFPDYDESYYAFYFVDLNGMKQEFVTFNS